MYRTKSCSFIPLACIWLDSGATTKTRLLLFNAHMKFSCVVTDKQCSEAIFMAKKMAKIWHKVQENGTKNIKLAKEKKNPSANPDCTCVRRCRGISYRFNAIKLLFYHSYAFHLALSTSQSCFCLSESNLVC